MVRNGEIWAVTREFWVPYAGIGVVTMGNVERRVREGITNFTEVARDELGIEPPYELEIGVVGIKDMRLSLPQGINGPTNQLSDVVHDDVFHLRAVLHNLNPQAQDKVVTEFLRGLYDVGVDF